MEKLEEGAEESQESIKQLRRCVAGRFEQCGEHATGGNEQRHWFPAGCFEQHRRYGETAATQDALAKNAQKAQKNLKKAQENLQDLQGPALESLGAGWGRTQDVVSRSAQQASKGLSQAAATAQDLRNTAQDSYASYQGRRRRARTLFRWGLVIGVVLALLYAPVTGEETRKRIGEQWQQYRN